MPPIRSHSTATSDAGWDGPANEARLRTDGDEAYYRQAFAWQDPDGDPATKAAYRFIHHEVSGDGAIGAANIRACQSAIGVLNGGRGGTTIPTADRQGVYGHLARHLRDADLEAPELQSRTERRTIVKDHPEAPADRPWALVAGGQRILATYATEKDARQHDERIRQNEKRDVAALRRDLPERERRFTAVPGLTDDLLGADAIQYRAEVELRRTDRGPQIAMWIPFNSLSGEIFGFREIIRPGAFTKTTREADVVALWNHDPMWVLGRRSNRTLTIGLSDDGAEAVAQLDAEDRMHQHFARRVERRDVTGASFGFSVVKEKWGVDETHDNMPLRELLEVRLFDISPVTFPAYQESDAEKRSVLEIAALRSGASLEELAEALAAMENGKVPLEHADGIRSWIRKLQDVLPADPADELIAVRKRRLVLRERQALAS